MKQFNDLCKEFEQMDPLTYATALEDLSGDIIPVLTAITKDERSGLELFENFILASVVADGKLTEEEYLMSVPLFAKFFGDYVNYEDCKYFVRKCKADNRDLKQFTDDMVDMLELVDDYVKDDIITVCLLICAVDGKVSAKEKRWIQQLIK